MPTTAILDLEGSLVQLKAILEEGLSGIRWTPEDLPKFHRAIDHLFQLTLDEQLAWVKPSSLTGRQLHLATDILALLEITVEPEDTEAFESYLLDMLNEHVTTPLLVQLLPIVGPYPFHAWSILKRGLLRILTPGGLMIDLDAFRGQSGLVEVRLDQHWKERHHAPAVDPDLISEDAQTVNQAILAEQTRTGYRVTEPEPPVRVKPSGHRPYRGRRYGSASAPRLSETSLTAQLEKDRPREAIA